MGASVLRVVAAVAVTVLAVWLLPAGREPAAGPRAPVTPPAGDAPPHDAPAAFPHTVTSNGGAFRVAFDTRPAPLPTNELFEVVGRLTEADSGLPLATGALHVDAAMPAHNHGMNTRPQATLANDGTFVARGMLFHMSGYWEIYFDLTRDGVTERAQWSVTLE